MPDLLRLPETPENSEMTVRHDPLRSLTGQPPIEIIIGDDFGGCHHRSLTLEEEDELCELLLQRREERIEAVALTEQGAEVRG